MLSEYSGWIALSSILLFQFSKIIYRLYFHPLSKIPGPKLAAVTHLYEFYYDVVCNGQFMFEIERMHEKYGPIIRINPREVHINDPFFYDEIYASSSRIRNKDPHFVKSFSTPESMVATVSHGHHRFRRNILNNFFSKKSILELSPVIESKVKRLTERLEESYHNNDIVPFDAAFAGLTADVITHYCYGRSWEYLEDKNYNSSIRDAVTELTLWFHINRFFPFFPEFMKRIPTWLAYKIQPIRANINQMQLNLHTTLTSITDGNLSDKRQMTIFDKLTGPELPEQEKTVQRLQDESLILLTAGTETTSRALTMMVFYLCKHPEIRDRLREELKTVMPTPTSTVSWPELEKLPYLSAVVNESLRLSYGVIIRLPRVAPTEPLQYNEYTIPPNTPLSSIAYFIHRDPSIFPDPLRFNPDRWIDAANRGEHLNRFLVSFTKGSRICLGLNLAYFELFTATAAVVRRFDIELYGTDDEDVRIIREMGIGYTKNGELRVAGRVVNVVAE